MQGVPFRAAYGKIGQLRSFVHYSPLCLTTTTRKETRIQIMKALHMKDTKLIKISPDKPNCKFVVKKCPGEFEDELMWVVTELKENKSSFSSTIIYCRSLSSCGQTRTGWFSQWYVHNVSFKAKMLHFQVHIRHCFWIPQNFACSFWQVECKIFYSLCKCTTQNRLLWSWGILDTNLKSNKGDMISYLIIIK